MLAGGVVLTVLGIKQEQEVESKSGKLWKLVSEFVWTQATHHADSGSVQAAVRVSVTVTGDALPQEEADGVSVEARSAFLHTGGDDVSLTLHRQTTQTANH